MRDVQSWRRLVLLAILKRTGAQTINELVERFQALAIAEAWPRALARDVDGPMVSGVLRRLAGERLVMQDEDRAKDPRAGRDTPKWRIDPAAAHSVDQAYPEPPDVSSVPREALFSRSGEHPVELPDDVIRAGLDELRGLHARHTSEIERFFQRLQARLGVAHE